MLIAMRVLTEIFLHYTCNLIIEYYTMHADDNL